MEFSEKLKIMRAEAGLTQEELGKQLCLSRQAISNYEQGRGIPSIDTLLKMSEFFGVGLDELLSSAREKRSARMGLSVACALGVALFASVTCGGLLSVQGEPLLYILLAGIYLLPFVYAFFGLFLFSFAPENPNVWIGYRTPLSTKNKTAWQYAQSCCGQALVRLSVLSLVVTAVGSCLLAPFGVTAFVVGSVVLVVVQLCGVSYPLISMQIKMRRFR